MVKRVRTYSGHAGLGAELRRLRGGRSLQQIARLSRTPPLADRIKPVAAPTLSMIENGISMPTLDTLYSLSVMYRTSMQRLYNIVGLERVVAATDVPDTLEETKAAYRLAMAEARWFDAVSLALAGESQVDQGSVEATTWRAARATCLPYVGLPHEGILLLLDCIEDERVTPAQRVQVLRNLAATHLLAGQPRAGLRAAREAVAALPDDLDPTRALEARLALALSLLALQAYRDSPDARQVGEALQLIRSLEEPARDAGRPYALTLAVYEAEARHLEGNDLYAAKRFLELVTEAGAAGLPRLVFFAWLNLGRIRRRAGRLDSALEAFRQAEPLALEQRSPEDVFEVSFELYLASAGRDEAAALRYRRRCERYHPLVAARTPTVVAFERLLAGGCP
jgi:tetratricopeptide (TPR) repeat protein